jgi:hypothetical protein
LSQKWGPVHGISNGRAWQAGTQTAKIYYIRGAFDALLVAAFSEQSQYFPANLVARELAKAVDHFYEEPENLPIPIVKALRLVTMRARGEDPGVVEKAIATERRWAMTTSK